MRGPCRLPCGIGRNGSGRNVLDHPRLGTSPHHRGRIPTVSSASSCLLRSSVWQHAKCNLPGVSAELSISAENRAGGGEDKNLDWLSREPHAPAVFDRAAGAQRDPRIAVQVDVVDVGSASSSGRAGASAGAAIDPKRTSANQLTAADTESPSFTTQLRRKMRCYMKCRYG